MRMGPRQAEAIVRAFLGRPPQDELEAAVVLESWGGVRPEHALPTAHRIDYHPHQATASARHRSSVSRDPDDDGTSLSQSLGVLAMVLAVLLVAGLADAGDSHQAADAWRPAMPVALGGTWVLRRRYGGGPRAVSLLRRDPWWLPVLAASAGLGAVVAPAETPMIAVFVALGLGSAVLAVRGWGMPAAGGLIGTTVATYLSGVGPDIALASAAGFVAVAVGLAVATAPTSDRLCRPWRRAVPAGLAGASTGLFLVMVSATASHATTWMVALAMVPSLVANLVGGARLAQFWQVTEDALAATPVGRTGPLASHRAWRVLGGALVLTVSVLAVLSALVAEFAYTADWPGAEALLIGFGAATLVAELVMVLEAFARPWLAVVAGFAASAVQAAADHLAWLTPTEAVAIGVAATAVVALPALVKMLHRPDHTLATIA